MAEPNTDTWARDALASLSGLPGTRRVGLALAEGGGRRLRFTASDRRGGTGVDWCHVDAYEDIPLNTAVRTGEPVFGALDELADTYAGFVDRQESGTAAVAAVPIASGGQVLGGFVLFFARVQAFDRKERAKLVSLGRRLGTELRRALQQHRPLLPLAREPVPEGAEVAVHEVGPEFAAIGEARRFLRNTLARWSVADQVVDTAVLCLDELVTNALIHTQTGCAVRVMLDDGVLTTAVRDAGPAGLPPPVHDDDPLRVHGRGLQLVEALADRWGSELDSVGTTVWFTLET